MSTQVNSLGVYGNPYGLYSPNNSLAMSDDIMAQQLANYYNQNQEQADSPSFQGNPQTDTFERSNPLLSSGQKLGLLGGIGTGAGMYFLGTNPVGEDALKQGFIKEFGKEYTKIQTTNVLKARNLKPKVFKELLAFKEGDDISKLSKAAKTYLTKHGIAKTDKGITDFVRTVGDEIRETDINYQNNKLAQYKNLEEGLKNLPDKKKATLRSFLENNAEALGLKGVDDAATKANIDNIMKDKKAYANVKAIIQGKISNQETVVNKATKVLDDVFNLWDKDKKVFTKGTTEDITQACTKGLKNFKWKTAGKWGAIVAGAGLVLGSLFGGGNKQA